MKPKISITLILLAMFLVTQIIGLFVVNAYTPKSIFDPITGELTKAPGNALPFGLETPQEESTPSFITIILSFAIAFAIIFILMKYKWKLIIRLWFFFVVILALGISINAFLKLTPLQNASIIAIVIAIPLAFFKIFKPHMLTHNITELFVYPGIAAVFVPILTWKSSIALLILISLYDMWAVWKSGIMQKMANFQLKELNLFGGFLIPVLSDKVKLQIKNIKQKYKNKKMPSKIKQKKFNVGLAILGGGDVIFPIIVAGVFMRTFGLAPALFITAGSLIGLIFLFLITKKGKAYPAMPYISTGIFLGMIAGKVLGSF